MLLARDGRHASNANKVRDFIKKVFNAKYAKEAQSAAKLLIAKFLCITLSAARQVCESLCRSVRKAYCIALRFKFYAFPF
jgi:hypothetical protein